MTFLHCSYKCFVDLYFLLISFCIYQTVWYISTSHYLIGTRTHSIYGATVSLDRCKIYHSQQCTCLRDFRIVYFFKTLNGYLQLAVNLETDQRNAQKTKTHTIVPFSRFLHLTFSTLNIWSVQGRILSMVSLDRCNTCHSQQSTWSTWLPNYFSKLLRVAR